jgi:hypothetical protein
MSSTAMVSRGAMGATISAPKTCPVTCVDTAYCTGELGSSVRLNPVIPVSAMGETAISPVIMDRGTVLIPDLERMV